MEKHNDILGQVIKSSFKVEHTSDELTEKTIAKVNSTPIVNPAYKTPLISNKIWRIIALFYLICFISIFFVGNQIDIWQFLNSLPFEQTRILNLKNGFIICTQIVFVLATISLLDYSLKNRMIKQRI